MTTEQELLERLGAKLCIRCKNVGGIDRLGTKNISYDVCDQCWKTMTFFEKYNEQIQVIAASKEKPMWYGSVAYDARHGGT